MRFFTRSCIFLLILYSLSINALAMKNLGRCIQLENGKSQIVISVGDKAKLNVSECLFGIPIYKGLSFSSSNNFIVYVDDSGFAHANMCGKAFVTVTDKYGRCDSISVCVKGGRKPGLIPVLLVAAFFAVPFFIIKIKSV